jgi:hypothetical protein
MEKEKKINCGGGKKKSENWLAVTIKPEVIKNYIEEYNGNKYVKLNINIGKPDKYGKDVSISIDTWTKEGETKNYVSLEDNKPEVSDNTPIVEDDLPW